jgi:RHS repeat-associated protein
MRLSLVGLTAGTSNYSYLTDAQGSVWAVTDSAGTVQLTYSYEPYGGTRSTTGVRKAPTNPRQYLSALSDGASYDLTARQYVPSTGRFLSPDPESNPGVGYQYGDANPMVSIDPFGKKASNWQLVAAGITAGQAATSSNLGYNCMQSPLCPAFTSAPAPLTYTAGAVSGANDGSEVSCASVKGGCAQAVVHGAVNGNAAGAGLHKAASVSASTRELNKFIGAAVDVAIIGIGAALIGASGGLALPLAALLFLGASYGFAGGAIGAGLEASLNGDSKEEISKESIDGGLTGGLGGLLQ